MTRTHLWFHQDQINEEHNVIMLDVFVGETLASWTLCQSHIATSHSGRRLRSAMRRYATFLGGIGWSWFGGPVDGRRLLGACVAAVKDMVESGDWIATFDTDGHTTLAKTSSYWSFGRPRCNKIARLR